MYDVYSSWVKKHSFTGESVNVASTSRDSNQFPMTEKTASVSRVCIGNKQASANQGEVAEDEMRGSL